MRFLGEQLVFRWLIYGQVLLMSKDSNFAGTNTKAGGGGGEISPSLVTPLHSTFSFIPNFSITHRQYNARSSSLSLLSL